MYRLFSNKIGEKQMFCSIVVLLRLKYLKWLWTFRLACIETGISILSNVQWELRAEINKHAYADSKIFVIGLEIWPSG